MITTTDQETLYYIYIGQELPKYGQASLKLAKKTSGCIIHLIGNESMRKNANNLEIEFTSIESFYNRNKFEKAESNLKSDLKFRSGFWSKSTERLFVLQQFMELRNLTKAMHVELDQIVFQVDKLIKGINSTGKTGIFIPFHRPDAVVASVIYVNKLEALNSLISNAVFGESFNNEMQLIARWAANNSKEVYALPTVANLLKNNENIIPAGIPLLDYRELNGLVDAAQLGQWIGGIDPRNVPFSQRPSTLFVDPPSKELLTDVELSELDFQINTSSYELTVHLNQNRIALFNLHLHSKAHPYLWRDSNGLSRLLTLANKRVPSHLLSMRYVQFTSMVHKFVDIMKSDPNRIYREINWRIKSKLRIRPSSKPFISGDTFRKISKLRWEHNSKKFSARDLSPGDIIFCESEHLKDCTREVLQHTKIPLVLILGNSDQNHSTSYVSNIEIRKNVIYFAQNLVDKLPDFEVLPIGIENAWRSNYGVIDMSFVKSCKTTDRKFRIMWGFTSGTNPKIRGLAAEFLELCPVADKVSKVSPKQHQQIMSGYAFVACPPGNGLDTHRFWEALYFKSIPVVLRSHMTSFYESIGLPIWIVESYEELLSLTESDLANKYMAMCDGFSNEAIWVDYWIDKIKTVSESQKSEHFGSR